MKMTSVHGWNTGSVMSSAASTMTSPLLLVRRLLPERYDSHAGETHISGLAWIGQHKQSRQERWEFILIAEHARDRDQIQWQSLLPGDRLTGWLTVDPASRTLRIDPGSGYEH